jgi:mannose-6-phosphate isomerase-like protein (cupin superfamily)
MQAARWYSVGATTEGSTMQERITPDGALRAIDKLGGQRWVTIFKHGPLELEFYAPRGADPQTPHTRDECYFVVSGSGWFVRGAERQRFAPGEVLYVPAGEPHRFEEFSDDFGAWAVFVG